MSLVEEFKHCNREFAQRFLKTAVVVDDEAYMDREDADGPSAKVAAPNRHIQTSVQENQSPEDGKRVHSLNARFIMDSFSTLGVICGVVGPTPSEMEVVRQADIVILDWLLRDGNPEYTMSLLSKLLTGERERNSLRLVAIYTGEPQLEDIYQTIFDELEKNTLGPKEVGNKTTIPYRHGWLVLYAKSAVNIAEGLKDRSVTEKELPGKLLDDFASMTEGLLPSIALTSLTAVREGEHKVLDRFSADLDPAFLAHRACLATPKDAEGQIVNHIAEELRGLIDSTVAEMSPANTEAVENWIRRKGEGTANFVFGNKHLNLEKTISLANNGLKLSELKDNDYKHLSKGFARCEVVDLDERLAWIMSFRTVFSAPLPKLWLGSVITATKDGEVQRLICITPRCDCIRLEGETVFIFLPLGEPSKVKDQLIIKLDTGFKRFGIGLDPAGWVLLRFKPSNGNDSVVATKSEPEGEFKFTDISGNQYTWQGELKAEYAQRIAQNFATTLSRVAVDESEWLRRTAK